MATAAPTSQRHGQTPNRQSRTLALEAALLGMAIVATLVFVDCLAHGVPAGPRATIPTQNLTLDSIVMFNNSGWALGSDSSGVTRMVLRTSDGALSWRDVTPPIKQSPLITGGFQAIDENNALLVASEGINTPLGVWSTEDGGRSWSKATGPTLVFKSVLLAFSDHTHIWLAEPGPPASQLDQQGIVIDRTVDSGRTWREVSRAAFPPDGSSSGAPPLSCGKSDLSFLNATTGWLTGGCTSGITFDMTSDGGLTWKPQPLPSPDGPDLVIDCAVVPCALAACLAGPCALSAPGFPTPDPGYMVFHGHDLTRNASRSTLYVSRDRGRSWNPLRLPGQDTKVIMVNASVGFASTGQVDSSAHWLYRTNDGGATWQAVATKLQLLADTLDCISTTTCFALTVPVPSYSGDEFARLYKTTDGGITWTLLSAAATATPLVPPTPKVAM